MSNIVRFRFSLLLNKFLGIRLAKTVDMPFYAVAKGRQIGVYMTWPECEAQVKGFSGARYKKFDTSEDAENFISTVNGNSVIVTSKQPVVNQSNKPKNSTSNLKRSYSTSLQLNNNKPHNPQNSSSFDSDDSDDLGTIVSKQLDDIEKRLKTFERGVDKIIKKSKIVVIDPPQPKKNITHLGEYEFEVDSEGYTIVYTDGACSANGKQGARAGLGVYWGDNHPLNISEPVTGRATNNCGEIQAATFAIKQAYENGIKKLIVNTDSQFLINSVTKWMPGWKRKGWKLKSGEPVKNEIDFKELDKVQNQLYVKWNYVEAHRGIHGNEMADQLAREGAHKYRSK